MGSLAADTELEGGSGRYRAHVHPDWEIWGPCGGYVAALALRAAGSESRFERPASFSCHYLRPAAFAPVDIEVTTLRSGRTAEAFRVSMTQDGREVLEALVWATEVGPGLEHELTEVPEVPDPAELTSLAERFPDEAPPYRFWTNLDARPVHWIEPWPPTAPLEARFLEWMRFVPDDTFADPWVDAARVVVVMDIAGWPAAHRHHAHAEPLGYFAPSLDLYLAFHALRPDEPWLLVDGRAPVAAEGLIGCTGLVWSRDGALLASGGSQLLCRPLPSAVS